MRLGRLCNVRKDLGKDRRARTPALSPNIANPDLHHVVKSLASSDRTGGELLLIVTRAAAVRLPSALQRLLLIVTCVPAARSSFFVVLRPRRQELFFYSGGGVQAPCLAAAWACSKSSCWS